MLAAILVGLLPAQPAAGADEDAQSSAGQNRATAAGQPYRMDLLEPGDFVSQTNDVQCIGASLQIMVNISAPRSDRTAATQRSLFLLARKLSWLPGDSRRPSPDWQPRGASSRGWARALRQLGIGNYVLRSEPTLDGALALAARTMRLTGLPVGLLVWRGRHAWVMTGFRATADPTLGTGFRVTSVSVADPWYPRVSSIWGRSPKPGSRLTPAALGGDFVPLNRRWRNEHSGRFLLVLPHVPRTPDLGALPA